MKTLNELKDYLESNKATIKATRRVTFYNQELYFYSHYHSNQLTDLIKDLASYYDEDYEQLLIQKHIKPIVIVLLMPQLFLFPGVSS